MSPAIGGFPVAYPGGGGVERDGEWVWRFRAAAEAFYRPGRRWPSRAGTVRWRGEDGRAVGDDGRRVDGVASERSWTTDSRARG